MNRWIVTFFGSGYSPKAPGTVGSAAITLLLALLAIPFARYFPAWQFLLGLLLLLSCAWSILLGPWAVGYFGRKDPQAFVLDEVAGICLANLFLPIVPGRQWLVLLAAFAAFRVFDIIKLPPARQLECLPDGWGILLDDLAAAVYANLVCQVLFRLILT